MARGAADRSRPLRDGRGLPRSRPGAAAQPARGLALALALSVLGAVAGAEPITLGPRPGYLVSTLEPGPLRARLETCLEQPPKRSDFSIGHRGAPLLFPEHTKESYEAAARMGAGILECDVAFTKDRQLVCRHAQCDLHTTTNILAVPALAAKCSEPFRPADPNTGTPASARCCTSDLTLAEFKTLCGKMDGANREATTVEAYLAGTARWRSDLHASCGTLLSHRESLALFRELGVGVTPELKTPQVEMPFEGEYTQRDYARQLITELEAADLPPERAWPQSFSLDDVRFWVAETPGYGQQAVYLDGRADAAGFDRQDPSSWEPSMDELAAMGVRIIAPPLFVLLALDEAGKLVPSRYARAARAAGLDIIAWTVERSGPLSRIGERRGGYYYQGVAPAITRDGDVFRALEVLASDVGVIGVFSDWPATSTFFAGCRGGPASD